MNLERFQLDETDVLAHIEGQALPADREARLRHAMRVDASIASAVDAMRSDRAALIALGLVQAPADLMQRVEGLLEREALLGLAGGIAEPHVDAIPISRVQPSRPSVVTTVLASPWSRRLAIAAGLALAAGVTLLALRPLWNARPHREIARGNDPVQPDVRPDLPAPKGASPTPPVEIARNDKPAAPTPPEISPKPPVDGPTVIATETPPAFQLPEISVEQALRLAREGRLAVRVAAKTPDQALARLENLCSRRTAALSFAHLAPERSGVVMASLHNQYSAVIAELTRPAPIPNDRPEAPPAIAGDKNKPSGAPTRTSEPARPLILPTEPVYLSQLFGAHVALDEPSLRALLRAVGTSADGATFVKLDVAAEAPPAMDPSSVLWWNGPSAGWTPKGLVPVIIELAR